MVVTVMDRRMAVSTMKMRHMTRPEPKLIEEKWFELMLLRRMLSAD